MLQDVSGLAGGYLYEYYNSDTSPDKTYYVPHGGPSTSQTPWSVAFDSSDNLYVEAKAYVWVECNESGGCSNTKVPSYSYVGSGSEGISQIAMLSNSVSSSTTPVMATFFVNQLYYYAPPAGGIGGTWTEVTHNAHCNGMTSMSIKYMQSDPNNTLYLTCLLVGSGSSVITELHANGTKNTISDLTDPVAAGAY